MFYELYLKWIVGHERSGWYIMCCKRTVLSEELIMLLSPKQTSFWHHDLTNSHFPCSYENWKNTTYAYICFGNNKKKVKRRIPLNWTKKLDTVVQLFMPILLAILFGFVIPKSFNQTEPCVCVLNWLYNGWNLKLYIEWFFSIFHGPSYDLVFKLVWLNFWTMLILFEG